MIRVGTPTPIYDLHPPKSATFITRDSERDTLALLDKVNRAHMAERAGDSRLEARIASYEMAARLQLSAPDVLDISTESDATRSSYGLDTAITNDMGTRCLVARRLLERGLRFVQVWSGADNGFPRRNWDSHENLAKDHGELGTALDKPVAGLLKDLRSRGLLDDTRLLDHRVRTHAVQPGQQGTRSQSIWVRFVARGRRFQRRHELWRNRRLVL